MMAKWSHLFPSRTQKLSILAAKIAGHAPVKIARCQVKKRHNICLFFIIIIYCFIFKYICYNMCGFNLVRDTKKDNYILFSYITSFLGSFFYKECI